MRIANVGAWIVAACLTVTAGTAGGQEAGGSMPGGLLRYPDISATHIVFAYGDDLWIVGRDGGTALPLVSPPGVEAWPRFSPDGATIAFLGNYDGNRDIYTTPTAGGVPHRVTHHPASEQLNDWTPDGRLLFSSNGSAALRRVQEMWSVGATGGLPVKMPIPYGTLGTISADGTWLAYTPHTRDQRTWKRYMGGMATDIWLYNLKSGAAKKITEWGGTDTSPMWVGSTLYYTSDAGEYHRLNLWAYDTSTGKRRQVTRYRGFDVKFPAVGPGPKGTGEIVFQMGSGLRVLDCASGEARGVVVRIPGAKASLRPRRVDASKFVQHWAVSPSGKRALLSARGDVWTAPAQQGSPRNLTRTSGVAERFPAWSPDGKTIAYFGDASGEYELYTRAADGSGEAKRRTRTGFAYRYHPRWSPDSKHLVFWDKTGTIYLHTLASGETRYVDQDPWGTDAGWIGLSWSHDSNWITYARNGETMGGSIWLYNVEKQSNHQVTSNLFNDEHPVFDRAGDYLYFRTNRHFAPKYGELDSSFIYSESELLVVVPLRKDQASPWAPKSDEETGESKSESAKSGNGKKKGKGKRRKAGADDAEDADDGVSGTWEGVVDFGDAGGDMPQGAVEFTITLVLASDNSLSGSVSVSIAGGEGGVADITEGSYDPATGRFEFTASSDAGGSWSVNGTVTKGDPPTFTGTATEANLGMSVPFSGKRSAAGAGGDADDGEEAVAKSGGAKKKQTVVIDLEGFEARAMRLPVKPGNFGVMAVNAKGQLLYVRKSARGHGGKSAIKLFDVTDKKKAEQSVGAGRSFILTGDGKKMLIPRGGSAIIQNAGAGGSGKAVATAGMHVWVDPRVEWAQLFHEAWRLHRDFFYDPGMHGVDWPGVRKRYAPLIAQCVTRNDVSYVIREMVSELNVGHAYYGGGDVESAPSLSVGMLGCDFALENGAYRIAAIHRGGDHDLDARGPLSRPGVKVAVGDYLLAVNGVALDTAKDPWAAFLGLAGRTITLTVSATAVRGTDAREVVVKALGSDTKLRYRAWIEANRRYVAEKTGGRVGYVYVPDTGVNGQSDLVRQYSGQLNLPALIIDERWNGGGQIPNRFIEMLNRPIINYWARRDGKSWPWPYDGHQGPKCMLINGHAGSGGDAFPAYFRKAGLGKLIGTRTWGGLVGISGNPGLIDGARVTVPTFGYYKPDGTWGIEGYGVDPDIEVIADPSKMRDGADPQLDAAIAHMLTELASKTFTPTPKPDGPDRRGMGVPKKDR